MKVWIVLLLVCLPVVAQAKSVRIIWSPATRLSAWLDNVPNSQVKNWCDDTVAIHIEPSGALREDALREFIPQAGNLLHSQCKKLSTLRWTLIDATGKPVSKGSVTADEQWKMSIPAPELAVADTTPWQRFATSAGCHFRTYWSTEPGSNVLISVDSKQSQCDSDGWLNGLGEVQSALQPADGQPLWFREGYPLADLPPGAKKNNNIQVVTANNQRLILANAADASSWLLLPWDAHDQVWRFTGQVLVKSSHQQANDKQARDSLIEKARQYWETGYSADAISWQLVSSINPQLRDPAQTPLATEHDQPLPAGAPGR